MSVEIQTMGEGGIFEIAAVVIDEVLEIQPFTDVEYEILSSARDILAEGSILEAATVATNSANTAAGLASEAASAANDAAGLANSATTSANTAAGAANSAASSANSAAGAANSAAGAANTAASSANSAASAANTAAATAASFVGTGPAGYYATLTALQAAYPAGDTGIYVELEYGHWYYWSGSAWIDGGLFQAPLAVVQTTGTSTTDVMSQKAITDRLALKADINRLGKNLYNPDDSTGGYIDQSGVARDELVATYRKSDFILIKPSTNYYLSAGNSSGVELVTGIGDAGTYIAFYDSGQNYIANSSVLTTNKSLTSPSNALFIRFTDRPVAHTAYPLVMLNEGTARGDYEEYVAINIYDEIGAKINYEDIVQELGSTTDKIMSQKAVTDIINTYPSSSINKPYAFNHESFLQSIKTDNKHLSKLAVCGDSLMANEVGGVIPNDIDEGNTMRPMRLLSNTIARRLYDYLSWNKPIWRRLDHSDWINSGFAEYTEAGLFEGTQEKYWKAETGGSYVEITIPNGYENFGLICREKDSYGKLNVTLNGSAIPTYINPYWTSKVPSNTNINESIVPHYIDCGLSQIDLNKGFSPTSNGNPYHIVEYNNLPSGDNTIRFTSNDSTRVDIWGAFYWTGNTMVVMNIAHGGHSLQLLKGQHLIDELYNEEYDSLLFEIPEMNECSQGRTIANTLSDLNEIIAELNNMDIDRCFMSCNPFGISILYDTNFYNDYNDPAMEGVNNSVRKELYRLKEPFIDIFQYFTWLIKSRGGSLEGGEGGLWFTTDGQHGNPIGVKLWWEFLRGFISANKPTA